MVMEKIHGRNEGRKGGRKEGKKEKRKKEKKKRKIDYRKTLELFKQGRDMV